LDFDDNKLTSQKKNIKKKTMKAQDEDKMKMKTFRLSGVNYCKYDIYL